MNHLDFSNARETSSSEASNIHSIVGHDIFWSLSVTVLWVLVKILSGSLRALHASIARSNRLYGTVRPRHIKNSLSPLCQKSSRGGKKGYTTTLSRL